MIRCLYLQAKPDQSRWYLLQSCEYIASYSNRRTNILQAIRAQEQWDQGHQAAAWLNACTCHKSKTRTSAVGVPLDVGSLQGIHARLRGCTALVNHRPADSLG